MSYLAALSGPPQQGFTLSSNGKQYPYGALPLVRLERGLHNLTRSYAEYVQSKSFAIIFRNSLDYNFKLHYDKDSKLLAGVDFQDFFTDQIAPFLLKYRIRILSTRFLYSGDVILRLHSYLDWRNAMRETPRSFTYRYEAPTGAMLTVDAPRGSPGHVEELVVELRGCTPRLESDDVHDFLESKLLKLPLSIGQFAIRYKMIGNLWNGDYLIYINTNLTITDIFSSLRRVNVPDRDGALFHSIDEILLYVPGNRRSAAAPSPPPAEESGQAETKDNFAETQETNPQGVLSASQDGSRANVEQGIEGVFVVPPLLPSPPIVDTMSSQPEILPISPETNDHLPPPASGGVSHPQQSTSTRRVESLPADNGRAARSRSRGRTKKTNKQVESPVPSLASSSSSEDEAPPVTAVAMRSPVTQPSTTPSRTTGSLGSRIFSGSTRQSTNKGGGGSVLRQASTPKGGRGTSSILAFRGPPPPVSPACPTTAISSTGSGLQPDPVDEIAVGQGGDTEGGGPRKARMEEVPLPPFGVDA